MHTDDQSFVSDVSFIKKSCISTTDANTDWLDRAPVPQHFPALHIKQLVSKYGEGLNSNTILKLKCTYRAIILSVCRKLCSTWLNVDTGVKAYASMQTFSQWKCWHADVKKCFMLFLVINQIKNVKSKVRASPKWTGYN